MTAAERTVQSKLRDLLTPENLQILLEFWRLSSKSLVAEELTIPVKKVSDVLMRIHREVQNINGGAEGIFDAPTRRARLNQQGQELVELARQHVDNLDLMLATFSSGMSVRLRSASNGLDKASQLAEALAIAGQEGQNRTTGIQLRMDYPRTASIQPGTMDKGTFAIFSMLLDPADTVDFDHRCTPTSTWTWGNTEMITLAAEDLYVLSKKPLPPIPKNDRSVDALIRAGVVFLVTGQGSVPDKYLDEPRVHPWHRSTHLQRIPHLDCGLRVLNLALGASRQTTLAMIVHGPNNEIEEKARRAGIKDPLMMPLAPPGVPHPKAVTVFAWTPSSKNPTKTEEAVWETAKHLWHDPKLTRRLP